MRLRHISPLITISLLWLFISGSCKDNTQPTDLLPEVNVNYIVNMNLPLYQDLLIPGGYAETPVDVGVQGILIYNMNNRYKAFDLACPHYTPGSCGQMTFDGSLFLECPCDQTHFSIYDGASQNENVPQRAREYFVEVMGGNQLRITN